MDREAAKRMVKDFQIACYNFSDACTRGDEKELDERSNEILSAKAKIIDALTQPHNQREAMRIEEEFAAWDPKIIREANIQPYFREYLRELALSYKDAKLEDFICWIGRKWATWREETKKLGSLTDEDHESFSAWLPGKVDSEIKIIMETPELNCHGLGERR